MIPFRVRLAKLIKPIVKFLGNLYLPFTRKKLTIKDCASILNQCQNGDILLSATKGEFTYLMTPSKWKHAAIICRNDYVVEATSKGVVYTNIIEFILKKDKICLLRANWCDANIRQLASSFAQELVGKPYDYEFYQNNGAFYCSELVTEVYKKAWFNNRNEACPWVHISKQGIETTTPSDFANSGKWDELYKQE